MRVEESLFLLATRACLRIQFPIKGKGVERTLKACGDVQGFLIEKRLGLTRTRLGAAGTFGWGFAGSKIRCPTTSVIRFEMESQTAEMIVISLTSSTQYDTMRPP